MQELVWSNRPDCKKFVGLQSQFLRIPDLAKARVDMADSFKIGHLLPVESTDRDARRGIAQVLKLKMVLYLIKSLVCRSDISELF